MYARFARAALAYPDRPTASELVLGAFDEAQEMGFLDAFVFGYRARPELLQLLADDPQRARQAITILERAQDLRLARKYRLTREPLWSLADPQLTPREIEVLRLIRDGYNNAEIAARLVISPFTAKVHVRHILEKLGVRSRFDAARAADAVLPED